METEVESLKEELEKILSHKERLTEENLLIQARHDVDKKALVIQNDDVKYEYVSVEKDISDIVEIIKAGRKREIALLEQLEEEEKDLRNFKEKGGALYLIQHGINPDTFEMEVELTKQLASNYDEQLSGILRRNIELKQEKTQLLDMINMMEDLQGMKDDERRIARDMVDSNIESLSVYN